MTKEIKQKSSEDKISSLRIDPNYFESGASVKMIAHIPVRKPNKNEFFRVYPDDSYAMICAILEEPETRDQYVLNGSIYQQFADLARPVRITTSINRYGNPFLWPLKLPTENKRGGSWIDSAAQAAEMAKSSWVRMNANMASGHYDVFRATGDLGEPNWPDLSFYELLEKAFSGFIISDPDHDVLKKLTGVI